MQYQIEVIKTLFVDLDSEQEANIFAELMVNRACNEHLDGNSVFVTSDIKEIANAN